MCKVDQDLLFRTRKDCDSTMEIIGLCKWLATIVTIITALWNYSK